ncbi:hypothetical protein [Pleomorphomonas oryzae]|uniref:hypothetical protein n=1 Tax=Pleomorphomonas oryzae TaxID=261934 RepID=UPI0004272C31|nr:hypothetical protein [Pleomorphomonas oryzae]
MTEELAISFILRSEWQIWATAFLLAALGGAISALLFISNARMTRAAYFLGNCVILLVAALSKALLVPTHGAFEKGHLGAWLVLWGLVQVGCGFALWRLALARSRHVLGHCGLAVLAFIPLANLWLFFVPGQEEPGLVRRERAFGLAAIRVVVGGIVIGATLGATMAIDVWKRSALATPGVFPFGMLVQFVLNRDGLESTIKLITSGPVNPEDSGSIRRLSHAANGTELQRVNLINSDDPRLIDPADPELVKAISGAVQTRVCEEEDLIPLLKAGATVKETYQDRAGRSVAVVAVKAGDCGL